MIWMLIIKAMYFALPAYIGNMMPDVLKNYLKKLRYPLDFGLNLRGKRVFGANKTFGGLLKGVVFAVLIAYIQKILYNYDFFQGLSLIDYSGWLWIGLLLGAGALFGDMIESFFKRQFAIKPGKSWFPFDQLDFIVGSLTLVSIYYFPGWTIAVILLLISPILHVIVAAIGYLLGVKKTWI